MHTKPLCDGERMLVIPVDHSNHLIINEEKRYLMKEVVLLANPDPGDVAALRSRFPDVMFHVFDADREDPEVYETARRAEVIAGSYSTNFILTLLQGASKVRWFHGWWAGLDHFPLQELAARGILLTRSPGISINPISETIIALLIMLERGLHDYVRKQDRKVWDPVNRAGEIHGKTMAILGAGTIGKEIARVARCGFGMRTLGYRRTGEPVAEFDGMYAEDQLTECLTDADYVVNILPQTDKTVHVINAETIAAMKPGALYVNIGRGRTTDTAALVDALRSGHLRGAGLDVFEAEPLPIDSPLWELENVIILPHTGGITDAYDQRALAIFADNLASYLETGEPQDVIRNPERGY